MTARAFLASALVLAFSAAAFAQPPRPPTVPAAPAAPQAPGQPAVPAPPSPAAPPTRATPPAPPSPAAPPTLATPPAPPVSGQHVNIRVDVTITDQRGTAPALKKTVSIVTADGLNGRIRSQTNYTVIGEIPLNVDAESFILTDGKIRVRVNLQYDLPGNASGQAAEVPNAGVPRRAQVQENLALILENGKPLVAAQSADPVSDRTVTIELKATVLK